MTASAIPDMTVWHAVFIALGGLWAGMINTIVGSGTLVTFPILVALGYPPLTATTSNGVGLITGTITGAIGYRKEVAGHRTRLIRYSIASLIGAVVGAVLLLTLPPDAFESVVPVLVAVAVVLVIVQPLLSKYLTRRRAAETTEITETSDTTRPGRFARVHGPLLYFLIFLVGVYGGYFTAAQGVLFIGVTGLLMSDPLQRLNGFKNVFSSVVNLVSGAIYAVVAPISWAVVLVIAVSSIAGGLLGATIGRKLSPTVLRVIIVVIGVAAIVQFALR